MPRWIAAVVFCLFLFSLILGVSAQGTDTGKYTAAECLQAQAESYKGDIPAVYTKIEAHQKNKPAWQTDIPDDFKSWQIDLYRIDFAQTPFFAAYEKGGSLQWALTQDYHYNFKLAKEGQVKWGWAGMGDYTPNFGVSAEFSEQFINLKTITDKIDSQIGRVNSIAFVGVWLETMADALFVSVETDQDSYIIPYNFDPAHCHLEVGKVYTEKRAMTILTTFLEDNPHPGYNDEREMVFGSAGTVEKNPTDAQIAALGLTDAERYGRAARSSQSKAQSSSSASSQEVLSSAQQEVLNSPTDWGTVVFIALEAALVITVGVLFWQLRKKKK